MNTTTNATRKIMFDGMKITVPETFPSYADILKMEVIPLEAARDFVKIAKALPFAGLTMADFCAQWARIEGIFHDAIGLSWQEALTSYEEMQADAPTAEGYPQCLPPASSEEVAQMERIYNDAPRFRPVSKEAYNQLFKGACISRRGGVAWKVWGERILGSMNEANRKEYRGLVALIAFRAYSMPSEQVKGF